MTPFARRRRSCPLWRPAPWRRQSPAGRGKRSATRVSGSALDEIFSQWEGSWRAWVSHQTAVKRPYFQPIFRQKEESWRAWVRYRTANIFAVGRELSCVGQPSERHKSSNFSANFPVVRGESACLDPPSDSRFSGRGNGVGVLGFGHQTAINCPHFWTNFRQREECCRA